MNNIINVKNNDITMAVKDINKLRLSNKNKWLFIEVDGLKEKVLIKGFGTWLQIFKTVDGRHLGDGCMDQSVSAYKKELTNGLSTANK